MLVKIRKSKQNLYYLKYTKNYLDSKVLKQKNDELIDLNLCKKNFQFKANRSRDAIIFSNINILSLSFK